MPRYKNSMLTEDHRLWHLIQSTWHCKLERALQLQSGDSRTRGGAIVIPGIPDHLSQEHGIPKNTPDERREMEGERREMGGGGRHCSPMSLAPRLVGTREQGRTGAGRGVAAMQGEPVRGRREAGGGGRGGSPAEGQPGGRTTVLPSSSPSPPRAPLQSELGGGRAVGWTTCERIEGLIKELRG